MITPTPTDPPSPTPSPASIFSQADFTYNGDGQRVKSAITTNLGTTTTYFVGNYYEVTDGVVTKYYYVGSQRIAMRENVEILNAVVEEITVSGVTPVCRLRCLNGQ